MHGLGGGGGWQLVDGGAKGERQKGVCDGWR